MSDASVMKEFLVALGVIVDDPGIKKFSDGIGKATKIAGELATGVEAMAVAVGAAVTKVSAKFEDLYYASQRIGASVENIRGFDFAIGQLGGTAQGAQQALENMGEFFRSNPGAERFVAGLGVGTREANGQMRDMTAIMGDLATKLRAMPYYQAKVVAGMLGIDPRTLQALLRDTGEAQARYHDLAKRMGVDQQAAAKASHDFMNDVREMLAVVTLAADKVILTIQPVADKVVRWFEDLDRATDGWSTSLIALTAVLGPLLLVVDPLAVSVGVLAAGIVALTVDFENWRNGADSFIDWKGWSDEIDHALKAMKTLGGGIADLVGAIGQLTGAWGHEETAQEKALDPAKTKGMRIGIQVLTDMVDALGNSLKVVADILTGHWGKAWEDAKKVGHDLKDPRLAAMARSPTGELGDGPSAQARARALAQKNPAPPAAAPPHTNPPAVPQAAPKPAAAAPARPADNSLPAGIRRNNPGNLRRWGNAPIEGGFANFATAQDGLTAMAKNLIRYGQRGLDTVKAIISTWAPANENDTAAYIRSVSKQLGVGANQALNLGDPATLQKLMHAITLHENGRDPYSSGLYGQAAASALNGAGRAPVQMNQKTDIHIHGVSDPHAAGREVQGGQNRVNGDMVRDLKSAVS
ncbi:MAG: hypothetical protein JWQ97_3939 [Phenylobacterium sp.]|nr:hypothetical protein [Phenylobacterium sp.]